MVGLSCLVRKLLRNLRAMMGQGVAIALVIAGGVSLLLLMAGMTDSLSETRRAYYERYAFADIWAPVVRAPDSLLRDVQAMSGVLSAESRVNAGAILDMPAMSEPAPDYFPACFWRGLSQPDSSQRWAFSCDGPSFRGGRAEQLCRSSRAGTG